MARAVISSASPGWLLYPAGLVPGSPLVQGRKMVSASRLARPPGVPYTSGFSAMVSDHRLAMTSAQEA